MTLEEVEAIPRETLLATEVAQCIGCDPNFIRFEARQNPARLGFPVICVGSRLRFPSRRFYALCVGSRIQRMKKGDRRIKMKFMRKKDQELEDLLEMSRQLQMELAMEEAKAAKGLVWHRFVPTGSPECLMKLGSLIERKALALDDLQLILQVLALPVSDGSCPVDGQVRMAFTDQTTTCPSYVGGKCIGVPPAHPPYTSRPVCPKTVSEEVDGCTKK